MRNNTGYVISLALLFCYLGACALSSHWDHIDREKNSFAKDCNDRGGRAEFTGQARQCVGASPMKAAP